MGSSIQFRGIDTVVEAFNNFGASAWSIWQGGKLLFRGVGDDELLKILEMIKPHGSDAIYMLKVYEDISDPKQIKDKTPADGSFGFKIDESDRGSYVRSLEDRVKKLEGSDGEANGIVGKIGNALLGLLDDPESLVGVLGAIKNLIAPAVPHTQFGNVVPAPAMVGSVTQFSPTTIPGAPVAVAPAPQPEQINVQQMPEKKAVSTAAALPVENVQQQQDRLVKVLDSLSAKDAKLLDHLEMLDKLASEKPQYFQMLLLSLENA